MKNFIYLALFINLLSISDYCLSAAASASSALSSEADDERSLRLGARVESPYTFEEIYASAVEQRKAENYELAQSLFERCLGSNSDEIYEKSIYNLGFIANKMGKHKLAYVYFSLLEQDDSKVPAAARNSKKILIDSGNAEVTHDKSGAEIITTKEDIFYPMGERLDIVLKTVRTYDEIVGRVRDFSSQVSGIYFKNEESYVQSVIKASSSPFTWSVGKLMTEVGSMISTSVCFRVSKDLFMTTGHSVQLFLDSGSPAKATITIGDKELSVDKCWSLSTGRDLLSMGVIKEEGYPFDCGLVYCPHLHKHPEIPILSIDYRPSIDSVIADQTLSEISYSDANLDTKFMPSLPSPRLRVLDLGKGKSSLYGEKEGSRMYLSRLFTEKTMGTAMTSSGFKDGSSSFSGVSGSPVINQDGQVIAMHARAVSSIALDMTKYILEKRLQLMHPRIIEFRDTVQALIDA